MERILEIKRGEEGELVITLGPSRRLPPPVRAQLRTTAKEVLVALRALLDASIRALEERGEGKGPTRIDIQ